MPRRLEQRYFLPARRSARRLRSLIPPRPPYLDAEFLRARLTSPHPADPDTLWADDAGIDLATMRPAAVLVGLTTGETPGVLLTKRTSRLTNHAGQVSFPGGRIDATDASPEAAALREAQEEIGLDPALPQVVGRLPDYFVLSGFRMTPVVALLRPGFTTQLSAHEVEAVFELPLTTVLDPAAPERRTGEFRGKLRHYWVWPHAEHYIWGATAAILVNLAARLR